METSEFCVFKASVSVIFLFEVCLLSEISSFVFGGLLGLNLKMVLCQIQIYRIQIFEGKSIFSCQTFERRYHQNY